MRRTLLASIAALPPVGRAKAAVVPPATQAPSVFRDRVGDVQLAAVHRRDGDSLVPTLWTSEA